MGKFNTKSTITEKLMSRPDATTNKEGGLAFEMDAKTKLVTETLATFVEPKFYDNVSTLKKGMSMRTQLASTNDLKKTIKAVLEVDPEFVLKLAVYARKEMNLRSVPLFLLNEYANSGASVPNSRRYVSACIQRADEITELLGLSMHTRVTHPEKKFKGKKTSIFIKEGLAPAFNKFDEYQFAKYNREGDVSLKDALLITHPKPKSREQQELFDKIVGGTLATPETWEVTLSGNGASKESWESILPKMGYMALLKNLRNFMKYEVDIDLVTAKLTDPEAVKKSKQFPFRFFSAYKAVSEAECINMDYKYKMLKAVETAMEISIANVPKIPGNTLVLVDTSGSMTYQSISERSTVKPADIAGLFGAISSTVCESSDIVVFADAFGKVRFTEGLSTLKKMDIISRSDVGCATYAHLPMAFARTQKVKYDRVILFSDMQCYDHDRSNTSSFAREFFAYQRQVTPAFLYSIDLMGYGTAQVPQYNNKVLMLAGFSEKLFDFIPSFESERETLVRTIGEYKI